MQADKTTKRAQQGKYHIMKVLKQAKLTEDSTMGVNDIFEVRRRSGKKFGNEESTTFDGVEMFTKQRKPPTPEKISAILAKGSLRDRFENLSKITSIEKMLMYEKYDKMCVMFKDLDEMLLFIKSKQSPSFLTNIQDMLYEARKVRLTQGFIQQVLTIFPEAYQLSWKMNEKLVRIDKTDLHFKIEVANNSDVDARLKLFKQKLFDYIHANGEYIPEATIPKNERATQMDQEKLKIIKQIESTPLKTEFKTNASKQPTYSALSLSIIEKIRAKKQNQQEAPEETKHQLPIKHYIQMASLLHTYYLSRNVSNMFVNNVIKYAQKSLKSIIADEKQLQGYLDKLCEFCPLWIKYVDNEQGKILRMDRNVDMPSIVRILEQL